MITCRDKLKTAETKFTCLAETSEGWCLRGPSYIICKNTHKVKIKLQETGAIAVMAAQGAVGVLHEPPSSPTHKVSFQHFSSQL